MAASSRPAFAAPSLVDRRLIMSKKLRASINRSLESEAFVPPRAVTPTDFIRSSAPGPEHAEVCRWPFRSLVLMCCAVTEYSMRDLFSKRRQKPLIKARLIGYWLARQFTLLSFPDIAHRFGGRDHSTVLYGVARVEKIIDHFDLIVLEDPTVMARTLWSLDWSEVPR